MSDIPIIGDNKPTRQWLLDKKIVPAHEPKPRPSGVSDAEVLSWDAFLDAFYKDRPRGLAPQKLVGLKAFILNWRWKGKDAHTMEIRNGPRDEDVVEIAIDEVPDFTYNPDGVKTIEELFMPYWKWTNAVADYRLNTEPSSYGEEVGKHEHKHWGGPVDVGEEPIFLRDDAEDIEKVFGL